MKMGDSGVLLGVTVIDAGVDEMNKEKVAAGLACLLLASLSTRGLKVSNMPEEFLEEIGKAFPSHVKRLDGRADEQE